MLSFRKGTAAAPSAARAMAEHLREQTLPEEMIAMADYYLRGVKRSEAEGTAAVPRQDMDPVVAAVLGLDLNRTAKHEEVVNLLSGYRADGSRIPGPDQRYRTSKGRDRITYVDFTFSAPKSVSVAMALAPTEAERHMIVGAHLDAWMAAMEHLEDIVGRARKGAGGKLGSVPGSIGWVSFDHYTARPTVEIPHTEADGTKTTLIQTVRNAKVAGDMQLHTHVSTPNVVVCEDGSIGSLDMLAMHDRVHEVGAYYQAHLATNLRAHGIEVGLDPRTDTAKVMAVPDAINDLFSKRTRDGEAAAREYVLNQGLHWENMHAMELARVLKGGTRSTRQGKGDDMSDLDAWKKQAASVGYQHQSVIQPELKSGSPAPALDRLQRAYLAALPVLEKDLSRRAVLSGSVARTAAARGLIAAGVESADDISAITQAMREHGVRHDGQMVPIIWAKVGGGSDAEPLEERRPQVKITTSLHLDQEERAMELASAAAADRSGTLTLDQIDRGIRTVSERDGLDFTSKHGLEQRRVMETLGTSGRLSVAVGVAGAGKTTLLRPLVEAWTARGPNGRPGREVYGTALAYRQSDLLVDAGIPKANTMAIDKLLSAVKRDGIKLNRNAVLVVDELSQVGTRQALALLELRAKHGFTMISIGDDKQGQAIEAGNSVTLLRKALGDAAVPELRSTVRQIKERDRETSLMFRNGDANAGITRLREDGQAVLVQGGRKHAIEAAADLWQERMTTNVGRDKYSLTVSTPTNQDAREVSAAIRNRRRAAGTLGPDVVTVDATDQMGVEYNLPLAIGDRVRLFSWTRASFGDGRAGNIGNNGSVVEIEAIDQLGIRVRNTKGSVGFVKWDTLRGDAESSRRVRLNYGDAISIDAIQSATSTEHLNVLPDGSKAVTAFKAYVAQSRSREATWLVVSDGRERSEIMEKRALGNSDPIDEDSVWNNIAANLSRQQDKEIATDLVKRAHKVHVGSVRSLASGFQPMQQREAEGKDKTTLHETFQQARDDKTVTPAAEAMAEAATAQAVAVRKVTKLLTGPETREARKALQAARRSTRAPAARPKKQRQASMSQTDAITEFADALQLAGLVVKGAPIMDGKQHRVDVEGDKKGRKSGMYVGHLDDYPAGYIHNHKTGEEIRWKASRPTSGMSQADRDRFREKVGRERDARDAERRHIEAVVAHKATAMWNRAKPIRSHAYLTRKAVGAHSVKQDRHGNLLVPMRDVAGKIWSLQTIDQDGGKLYLKNGRKTGTHAVLGKLEPNAPIIIAEGYATAATMREVTGLPAVAAFDSGNLLDVAKAYREADPTRPIILAGDNDHHLPRRETPLPNVGMEKATMAVEAVGGVLLLPAFTPADGGTDWNDYAAQHGREALRATVGAELGRHGIILPAEVPKPGVRPMATQAERDAARARASSPARSTAANAAAQEAARRTNRPTA